MAQQKPGPSILIADDDTALLMALKARLEAEGYTVVAVQDGYTAIDRAAHLCPDLLILDVNMPAGNGFSVQMRMKKIEELADTPVVYLTGSSADSIDTSAAALGAFAVIHKPFQTEELLSTVATALALAADTVAN